jgi:hypothetical protein
MQISYIPKTFFWWCSYAKTLRQGTPFLMLRSSPSPTTRSAPPQALHMSPHFMRKESIGNWKIGELELLNPDAFFAGSRYYMYIYTKAPKEEYSCMISSSVRKSLASCCSRASFPNRSSALYGAFINHDIPLLLPVANHIQSPFCSLGQLNLYFDHHDSGNRQVRLLDVALLSIDCDSACLDFSPRNCGSMEAHNSS